MGRRFSLREAESMLPEVSALIQEAVALKTECQEAETSIEGLRQKLMLLGGVMVDRARAQGVRQRRDDSLEKLKSTVAKLHETGALIKDLDKGLVDFPTLFRGQEVYLCWKMDEDKIEFWHGDEGFSGRKPIDQDFLDNHRGDPVS